MLYRSMYGIISPSWDNKSQSNVLPAILGSSVLPAAAPSFPLCSVHRAEAVAILVPWLSWFPTGDPTPAQACSLVQAILLVGRQTPSHRACLVWAR